MAAPNESSTGGIVQALVSPVALVAVVWLAWLLDVALPFDAARFGVIPRTPDGLYGVALMPFVHGSLTHIVANSTPMLVLGLLTALDGRNAFWLRVGAITLLTGVLTWLFAGSASHIGASGLVFGLLGFLLARAWFTRHFGYVAIAVIAGAGYGGVLIGVLPIQDGVSWEGHLFGLVAGIAVARLETWRTTRARQRND